MKQQNPKEVYCTNMDKNDPIIEKFMKEYLEEKKNAGETLKENDLIVNFNITYADGEDETYTCGAESGVFGKGAEKLEERKCKEEKVYKEEKVCKPDLEKKKNECYCKEDITHKIDKKKDNCYYHNEKESEEENCFNYEEYLKDFEPGKWANCNDEWYECSNRISKRKVNCCNSDKNKKECIEKKTCKKDKGKITVYSILSCENSQTLKGVKINLYKLNGITPKLVDSKETDEEGKAVFSEVENGCYRVIEIIDKVYFEKPTYLTWNEFNISDDNTSGILYVLNYLKQFRKY